MTHALRIRRAITAGVFAISVAVLFCATWAQAQTETDAVTEPATEETAVAEDQAPLIENNARTFGYAQWEPVAERAEGLVERNQASPFALDRLRTEITEWREVFADAIAENAGRVTTLDSQIAALGAVPAEGETEAPEVTSRREALIAQRDALAAPGLLAAEAHARASGLIREAETQLRARQTDALLERTGSPLNPAYWGESITQFWAGTQDMGGEVSAELSVAAQTPQGIGRIIVGIIAILVAVFLFVRGPKFARSWGQGAPIDAVDFLAEITSKIAEAALPLLGLIALTYGIAALDIVGPRAQSVLATIPLTGSIIILSAWLARQFFPVEDRYGPLQLDPLIRAPARRAVTLIAWIAALWIPFGAFVTTADMSPTHAAVLGLPIILVLSLSLYRFGRLLRNAPSKDADPDAGEGRVRHLVGRSTQGP